jgi:hypothetical protein
MRKNTILYLISLFTIIIFVSACSIFNPDETYVTPTVEPANEPTAEKPTSEPTNEVQPVATATESEEETVTIYLIAIGDDGNLGEKIGCDDSLVPVEVSSDSLLESPWNALEKLLNIDADFVSELGLYNALDRSNLKLVEFETKDNSIKVYLEGEMMLGGVCDTPRVEEQLYATILQEDRFNQVEIYLNGELLEDFLSLK